MTITLQDLDHFRNNPMVQFKEETVGGVDVVIPCYMISDEKLWEQPLAQELRGHVFRKDTGECISLALHKFFNINEKESTMAHNIDWTQPFTVYEKKDGSMITAVVIDDEVYFKTKKSFYSDVAKLANQLATDSVKELVKICFKVNWSPIFEFTHPDWKVVIDYGQEPTWTLIAVRNMKFLSYDISVEDWGFPTPLVRKFKSYDEIQNSINEMEGMEGYVISFHNGLKYKTKCNWYMLRHHINTDLRERDVAKMVIDETIDDIKSTIVESGYSLNAVEEIEKIVNLQITDIIQNTEFLLTKIRACETRKDAALLYSKFVPYFGLAMKLYDGKEPDYKATWKKMYLDSYTLRTIYSDFNHTLDEQSFFLI